MNEMNHTLRMTELLRQLKREKNGAVVENMEMRGIHYPLNYGVSSISVKRIAAQYGKDDSWARFLYSQQVRELQLASFFIADSAALTLDGLGFWLEGIVNTELAENFASSLLVNSKIVKEAVSHMLVSDNVMHKYAALVCVIKSSDVFSKVEKESFVKRFLTCGTPLLENAADRIEIQLNY